MAFLLLPLAYLLVEASQDGWSQLRPVLFRHYTATLLWNTVCLVVVVTAACACVGIGVAWLIERTDVPGRRFFAVLAVLPIAVPRFVLGSEWASVFPQVHGLWGAALVMSLALYPLVYLPTAAGLRSADASLEETALGLGSSRLSLFMRVTLRQVRPALLGGCMLVALATLAEYGAFEALRFQTFTTEIFTQFNVGFDAPAACALSLVLVLLGLVILCAEATAAGRGRLSRTGPLAARVPRRLHLRRSAVPAAMGLAALSMVAMGVPIGTIAYWMFVNQTSTLPDVASVWSAALHSVAYSAPAAALATVLAVPVAWSAIRNRSRTTALLERGAFFVQGLPGLVIGLGFVFLAVHYVFAIYQQWELLVIAYTVIFFPLSLVAVRASVVSAPVGLEEIGQSLGRSRPVVALKVSFPLLAPGLAAAFCLVFLSAITELTATLLLIPIGAHTLATQFWAFQNDASDSAAAPYAAVMLAIAVVPGLVIGRWFNRLPAKATVRA